MSVHRFRPRLPMRALLVGGGLAVAGALLAVVAVALTDQPAWTVPGVVLVVLGTVLVGLAALSTRRNAAEVELDEQGYRVVNRTGVQQGRWVDVASVKQSVDGDRLTFVGQDGSLVHVVAAQGSITSLTGEVLALMNRSRGYGRL